MLATDAQTCPNCGTGNLQEKWRQADAAEFGRRHPLLILAVFVIVAATILWLVRR